jgi:hypothetical protein
MSVLPAQPRQSENVVEAATGYAIGTAAIASPPATLLLGSARDVILALDLGTITGFAITRELIRDTRMVAGWRY